MKQTTHDLIQTNNKQVEATSFNLTNTIYKDSTSPYQPPLRVVMDWIQSKSKSKYLDQI